MKILGTVSKLCFPFITVLGGLKTKNTLHYGCTINVIEETDILFKAVRL